MKINAYLSFSGDCKEALTYYRDVLGGEIVSMETYAGSPMADMAGPDWQDKIMHGGLETGGLTLMGSDVTPDRYEKPQGCHLSISVDDPAEADRIFAALAESGEIVMPIDTTFWAERFGMLTDRFGQQWMVNCDAKT